MSNQFPENEYGSFPDNGFDRSDRANAWSMGENAGAGPTGGYGFDAYPGQGTVSASDDRTFATIAALSGPVGMLFSLGWLGFAGPLIVWAIYRNQSPFLRDQAARAFNFQLGMTLLSVLAWILLFTVILVPVSVAIWIIVFIFSVYHPIKAAIGYPRGESYRYPLSLRVLS
ncbi:MAG: DUF4870 domain-containing protein [Ancrocorticia populi]|uniref:DUF4870 domain-containing protein n=1 Tax=Ancrocorticia populi TaxID=2175228 RepID=UPI003F93DAC3